MQQSFFLDEENKIRFSISNEKVVTMILCIDFSGKSFNTSISTKE